METEFSFQDLLTQMHIDEIEEAEANQVTMVDQDLATVESMMGEYDVEIKEPSFLDFMTGLAIKEAKMQAPSFTDILTQAAIYKAKQQKEQASTAILTEMPSFTDILTGVAISESKKPSFTDIMVEIATAQSKEEKVMNAELLDKGLPYALAHLALKDTHTEAPVKESAEVAFLRDISTKQNHFETWGVTFARAAHNYWTAKH